MAEGVVDFFEMVEVAHQNRKGVDVALGPLDFLGQLVVEIAAVKGAGQGVADRKLADFGQAFFERRLKVENPAGTLQPHTQLRRMNRLYDIVVSASLEADHQVIFRSLAGQHDDVNITVDVHGPDQPAELKAVHFRHDPVGDDYREKLLAVEVKGLLAVAGNGEVVTFLGQERGYDAAGRRVFLDNQDPVQRGSDGRHD